MRKPTNINWLLYLVIALWLTFIFYNTLQPVAVSAGRSNLWLERLSPFFEVILAKDNITDDHIVRKLAHFIEYFALGGLLTLYLWSRKRVRLQNIINIFSFSLAVAVIDEALQFIPKRGPMVADVLLDFCGAATGIICVLLLDAIVTHNKKSKKTQPTNHSNKQR